MNTLDPLDPLIVVSAAPRMGSTLVQRLLCSSPNCLIFGDPIGHDAAFFLSYAHSKSLAANFGQMASLERVLNGDLDDFIADLTPETTAYGEARLRGLKAPLELCRDTAQAAGRPVWGWKMAGAADWALRLLPHYLSRARLIWIDRPLEPTLRSAKAAGMVGGADSAREFVAAAKASHAALAELERSSAVPLLRLGLDELTGDETAIDRLQDFSGATRIDQTLLANRVNRHGGGWTPPAELEPAELAALT